MSWYDDGPWNLDGEDGWREPEADEAWAGDAGLEESDEANAFASLPDEFEDSDGVRWPLDHRGLYPRERWRWFEQLWNDVCALRERYRLPVRSGWWEDPIQVEALAALAAWTHRYDSGEWDDPPGKLALLYDLERIAFLLRDGAEPFHPGRDRTVFVRHLIESGCQPPPAGNPQ